MTTTARRLLTVPQPPGVINNLPYSSDSGQDGLVHFLGTKNGMQAFANPTQMGGPGFEVSCRRFETGQDPVYATDENSANKFQAGQGSPWSSSDWLCYDLGPHRKMKVSRLGIQSRNDGFNDHHPLNWVLEGSNDAGASFATLYTSSSSPFTAQNQWKSFVVGSGTGYSMFRLRSTGNNSNSAEAFIINGVEFWGDITTTLDISTLEYVPGAFNGSAGMGRQAAVSVAVSSSLIGSAATIVDGDANNEWHSDNNANNWWRFDAGAGNKIVPYYFTFHTRNGFNNVPLAWRFQGSDDASAWTSLDTQPHFSDDRPLYSTDLWKGFWIPTPPPAGYRYVRFIIDSATSDNFLVCNEADVYGNII